MLHKIPTPFVFYAMFAKVYNKKKRMKSLFKVVAIDASARPNDVPISSWVEKDEVYNVTQVDVMNLQNGTIGFKLAEKPLDKFFPYQYFRASRFRPYTELDAEAEQAAINLVKELEELESYA